jgi:hypothetical protein
MDTQLIIVLIIFGFALFFIGRKMFLKIQHKSSSDCSGCDAKPEPKKAGLKN